MVDVTLNPVTPVTAGGIVTTSNPFPVIGYASNGNAVAYGFTPQEITTKTTTNVKVGAGMIGSIIINKTGATDVVTVYDALTAVGTPIATITTPTIGMAFCVGYNFGVGLTIVTSGGTAGAYTVAYA